MDEIEVLVRNAHGRVIQSMGGEAEFDKRVLSQLPLVPTDDHVMAIARPCGWQDEWMMKPTKARAKKAAAKAAASGSGNVVDMLANVSNEASSAHAASHDEAALQHDNVMSHGGSSGVPAAGMPASVAPATPVPMAAAPAPVPSTPVPSAARHVPSTPMELDPAGAVVPPMTPMRPPRPAMPRQSESHAAPPCMEAVVEAARSKAGFPSYGASNGSGSHDDSRDEPFCLICRSDMHPRDEECEALPCGHAFHMMCLREWRETCGVRSCDCPLKCHQRNDARVHPLFRRSGDAAGSRDGASGGGEDNSHESHDHRLPDLPHSDNSGGSDHDDDEEPAYM